MPKEIYNEGRVVGLSAYEIYVKQHLAIDPNSAPASEREWLASSIAMGSSLLLKVPYSIYTGDRFIDIQLPHNSNLAAANTIVASFFDGEAHFPDSDSDSDTDTEHIYPDDVYWADRIIDYGQLISNTSILSPDGIVTEDDDAFKLPTQSITTWPERKQKQLLQYMNIIDGIVIQPGEWVNSDNQPPEKDFIPDLSYVHPRVRLHVRGATDASPLILLTGFTITSVLAGITGDEGSTNTDHPENGDFLGPDDFPWVAKIVFSVPNSFINYMLLGGYTRKIMTPYEVGSGSTEVTSTVDTTAYIDMKANNPRVFYDTYNNSSSDTHSMYNVYSGNPQVSYVVDVSSTTIPNSSVLTVYQRRSIYPPALYATLVTTTGSEYLNPLDIVAPGSVKMFYGRDMTAPYTAEHNRLVDYETTFPGTHAFNLNTSGKIQYVFNDQVVTLASESHMSISATKLTNTNDGKFETPFYTYPAEGSGETGAAHPRLLKIQVGDKFAEAFTISSGGVASNPQRYAMSKTPAAVQITHSAGADNLSWSSLMYALCSNKSLDLLGDRLKEAKYTLNKRTTYNKDTPGEGDNWKKTQPDYIYGDMMEGSAYLRYGNGANSYMHQYISRRAPFIDADGTYYEEASAVPPYGIPISKTESGTWLYWYSKDKIPMYSISAGWGPYVYRKYSDTFGGSCRWLPLLGGEYRSGHVEPGKYVRFPKVWYGLVIFGRTRNYSDGQYDNVVTLKDWFNTTPSGSHIDVPTIVFCDQWRNKLKSEYDPTDPYTSARGKFYISVNPRFTVTWNSDTGLTLQNKSNSVDESVAGALTAEYIIIGDLYSSYRYSTESPADDNQYASDDVQTGNL